MTVGIRHTPASFWAMGVRSPSGCLLFTGHLTGKGYGLVTYQQKTWSAHRLAWLLTYGSLPPAPLVLDHLCRVRNCIEPTHLEPVTNYENTVVRGENWQTSKTSCPAGHEYTPANTRITPTGKRVCRTCHRDRERARRLRKE